MNGYDDVRLEIDDHIAVVTMDRPPVNALSINLYRELARVFREIDGRTDEVRAAILTGAGRAFSAGRDLKLAETDPPDERHRATREGYSSIFHCAVPVIAAVNGYALGAGMSLAMMSDVIIASETATFGAPQIDAGINMAVSTLLRGFTTYQARWLAFSGERMPAAEAHRMGLVQKVVPPEGLLDEALRMAGVLASKSPTAMRAAKWSANEVEQLFRDFERAYRAIEFPVTLRLLDTPERREAGRAFAEKRAAVHD